MLAGERSAVRGHEIGRFVDEGPELCDAGGRGEIEVRPRVHAAVAEVAVEIAAVFVSIEQRAEIAQISAELLGRDGSVLPPLPHQRLARHVTRCTESRLAHRPHESRLRGAVVEYARPRGLEPSRR